jgi:hypothetical protein
MLKCKPWLKCLLSRFNRIDHLLFNCVLWMIEVLLSLLSWDCIAIECLSDWFVWVKWTSCDGWDIWSTCHAYVVILWWLYYTNTYVNVFTCCHQHGSVCTRVFVKLSSYNLTVERWWLGSKISGQNSFLDSQEDSDFEAINRGRLWTVKTNPHTTFSCDTSFLRTRVGLH